MLVSVCGLIGSGKSTLVKNLATNDKFTEFQEPVETNPFLELYYKDPKRWSYAMQVNLLFERYKQMKEAYLRSLRGETVVIDSTIYSDMAFAIVQNWENYFTSEEYNSYINMHKVISSQTVYPDLFVFLELTPNIALERIAKRSRTCEAGIPIDYLNMLLKAYRIVLDKLSKYTNVLYVDARMNEQDVYNYVKEAIEKYKSESNKCYL